jgi:hypothetical protein
MHDENTQEITPEGQHTTSKSTHNITTEQFAKMEHEISHYWPTAGHLPKDKATVPFFEYAQRLVRKNPVTKTDHRRDEFRTFLKEKVEKLLGKEVAESVYTQLATNHSVATAQHYTPLSPKTLNPTLQMSLAYFGRTEKDRENLIILGCSGISFNNHWGPRGYTFHSLVDTTIVENQLNFFGRAADAEPVISADPYSTQLQKSMHKTLLHYRSEKLIKKRELNKIKQFIDEIVFTPHVLSQKKFVDQISIVNFHLWKKIFEGYEGTVPNLVFLSQEKIAAELLNTFHIHTDTLLNKVMFDKKWHELIYKYFNNIMCAFSVERKYGTFLFWATPKNTKDRIQLFAKDGVLVSQDNSIQIPMTPNDISKALANEELVPSTMMTFLVLGMYYGFFLTGGLDQPTYLTQTKAAYISLLKELGLTEEIENITPIVSNDIVLTRATLAFLGGPEGQRVPASGLDMWLHTNAQSWLNLIEVSKQVTFQDLLYRLYPELYRDYCEHTNKDKLLLEITERDIEKYEKLDEKIPPLTTLTTG